MLKWTTGQVDLPVVATVPSFDFVVAERPKYIPGSGPALAPVTAMPPHNKDGFIIDKVQFKWQLRYLVGYEEYPQLKVSVQPENILDWVSRHALEEWEANRYEEEERRREEEELPLILAKEERRRKRIEAMSRAAKGADGRKLKRKQPTDDDVTPTKTGRPVKLGRVGRPSNLADHGSRRSSARYQPDDETLFTPPRPSQRSQRSQQPSLSTPSHIFDSSIMIDTESIDEGSIDTDMAIDLQLGITDTAQPSRSTSESANMLGRRTRSTSNSNTGYPSGEEDRMAALTRPQRHASILPGQSAVAATSSREVLRIYEDLERKNKSAARPLLRETQSPLKRRSSLFSSYSYNPPSNVSNPAESSSLRSKTSSQEADSNSEQEDLENDEDETEYEIHEILGEEMREVNGKLVLYYLIDWVGEYDNTWEPAKNVSEAAIADFMEKRRMQQASRQPSGYAESDAEREYTPRGSRTGGRNNGKGKTKMPWRGQVVDDDDGSDE